MHNPKPYAFDLSTPAGRASLNSWIRERLAIYHQNRARLQSLQQQHTKRS